MKILPLRFIWEVGAREERCGVDEYGCAMKRRIIPLFLGIFQLLTVFFIPPLSADAAESPVPGNNGSFSPANPGTDPIPIGPDVPIPPGILNPNFVPKCEYSEDKYDCDDFASDYCNQLPSGKANCFYLLFCGEWKNEDGSTEKVCHVTNVTRVPLEDGRYLYCVVEPQDNSVIDGSCWVDGDRPNRFPRHLYEAICRGYAWRGLQCEQTPEGPRLPKDLKWPKIYKDKPWWILGVSPLDSAPSFP
jgi:hypothetical protein